MLKTLGQIFSLQPLPRQPERSDARMPMRRKAEDDASGRKKRRKAGSSDDLEDSTLVSVHALVVFLDNVLKTIAEKPKRSFKQAVRTKEEDSMPGGDKPDEQAVNRGGKNAYATQAYQDTAIHTGHAKPSYENLKGLEGETPLGEKLHRDDIRVIHTIQKNLKTLRDSDVEYLEITRGERFLESLLRATEKAMAQNQSR